MIINIWHEDAPDSSTTKLFQLMIGNSKYFSVEGTAYRTTKFENGKETSVICTGHTGLSRKIRTTLKEKSETNPNNLYIIFLDYVPTTTSIKTSIEQIENYIKKYELKNVFLAKAISFEYILLTLKKLIDWTKPNKYNQHYNTALKIRKELMDFVNTPDLSVFDIGILNNDPTRSSHDCKVYLDIRDLETKKGYTSLEEVSTRLLADLCNWHPGFRYSKVGAKLGTCWYNDCCFRLKCEECELHSEKDLKNHRTCRTCSGICKKCNLSSYGTQSVHVSAGDKANEIIENSVLYEILKEAHKQFLDSYGAGYLYRDI